MAQPDRFEYLVCYGVADRVTFSNGEWLGDDIPEAQRKQEDVLKCPLMWEFLANAGAEGWELVTVLEAPPTRFGTVRTYFLKRRAET
jgi:hypothetical protein